MADSRLRTLRARLSVLLLLAPLAVPAAEDVSVHELLQLLRADVGSGVIRAQVENTGTRIDLTVNDLLSLRAAGATDDLLAFLQQRGTTTGGPQVGSAAAAPSTEITSAGGSVRVIRQRTIGGGEALVLTNLGASDQRLDTDRSSSMRGIISSSDKQSVPSAAEPVHPGSTLLPSLLEVTVRHEGDGQQTRLEALEERVDELATTDTRPPVGAGLPRHAINDHQDYPLVSYPFGYPTLVPFAFQPQEFKVVRFGPFTSFTAARAAGVDPFRAAAPCKPGQACSIQQRLSQP